MKLLQLLAKELREWPSGAKCMTQNSDASAVMLKSLDVVYRNEIWVGADGVSIVGFRNLSELATDHATAIVTRADWEAEKARIAGKVDGGWKRHKRKSQPVSDGAIVEIRTRGGEYETCEASCFSWGATGNSQIMAYRIHKPAEQPAPASEEAIQVGIYASDAGKLTPIDEVKARYTGSHAGILLGPQPLAWRDRIYELDTQRAELEATYQRQIGEIDGERGELVERLAGEGLALVEVVQPVEDMSDWRNWKAGDLITCMTAEYADVYEQGKSYAVKEVRALGALVFDDCGAGSCCSISGRHADKFKWHSRPGK